MKMLKIGIIGAGNIAEVHMDAYRKNSNVELYAICDANAARLQAMGDKYDIQRRFTDYRDLLALEEIDAVSVCTWNAAHAPCTIAALRAGKHVLCEKPMAMNARDAKEMETAAQESGKLLMIGFVRRYGDDCKLLQELAADGFFGELYYAKATYLRRFGSPGGWFSNKAYSGGGPLIDLGVHVIDLVSYLAGKPKPISVYGATFNKLGDRNGLRDTKDYVAASDRYMEKVFDVEDLAAAMIRFDNGLVLSVEASFSLNIKEDQGEIALFGSQGGAKLSPALELYNTMGGHMMNLRPARPDVCTFGDMFSHEIDHFVDCIQNGTSCKSPAADGVSIMRILDAVYESARTGHEVVLD